MRSKLFPVIITAALTSAATVFVTARFQDGLPALAKQEAPLPVNYAAYDGNAVTTRGAAPVDFRPAAEASVKAVVHIKTQTAGRTVVANDPFGNDFFGDLFGQRQMYMPPQQGSGSGVVVSPDGYVVTNNHVVAGADKVTVTFNDRVTMDANVVSTDPSTDIAVLKVSDKNLPYMEFGNSDDVNLGQWVLAVGYPLTLDATVTAGIVSAKGRSIGINRQQSASAIESFIQTDAAVNPGNSGGALVNTSGQLIGINSAIASPTGSYAGYSYAIPANIVKKVVNDMIKFGSVQRAYLGIEYVDRKLATPQYLAKLGITKEQLERTDGVFIGGIKEGSGAAAAGLQLGDAITHINGNPVATEPQMLEQIARHRPGDNVSVTYLRNGATRTTTVQLKNIQNNTNIIKNNAGARLLGANFRNLEAGERQKYGVEGGVVVTELGNGSISQQTDMRKGFVITAVNDENISTVDQLQQLLASNRKVQIAGFYPGSRGMYYYGLNNDGGTRQE
ncbi:MAG: PDZ domain-containing protein [Sphingobacteriales bacterium]|nr:MAG: PDZ domain-containing protein [Sphingobacteriales bacterium]